MKKRTQKEFFALLATRAKKRRFVVDEVLGSPFLVERVSQLCPVCAVAKELGFRDRPIHNLAAWVLGVDMGFRGDFINRVIRAADGDEGPLRNRLLAACGVVSC